MVDMVPEARKWHAQFMQECDGKEDETMKMVRLMADDIEGWEQAFELYFNANLLATELYREAHPDYKFKLPDQGKMISWLVSELTRLRQKTCDHDYEPEDDKGWTCKKCGHGT